MKNALAISLILLLSWPTLLKVAVFANWQANRDYIAQNLCENRENPESDCEGNCQLVKETEKTAEGHSPLIPAKAIENISLEVFECTGNTYNIPEIIKTIKPVTVFTTEITNSLFAKAFFHPPEVV